MPKKSVYYSSNSLKAKAGYGTGAKGKAASKKREESAPRVLTEEQKEATKRIRRELGSSAWASIRVSDMNEYIKKCGFSYPSKFKKVELQGLLIAPGVGVDPALNGDADSDKVSRTN